jgi:hypothetical protein
VWEGLLGLLPDAKVAAVEAKFRRRKKWKQAVACYEINELLARKIWDLSWRINIRTDLITHLGFDFGEALKERIDVEGLPFQAVWAETPEQLERRLATMVDIRTIYHPFTDRQFAYGGKGRVLLPQTAHQLFGAL